MEKGILDEKIEVLDLNETYINLLNKRRLYTIKDILYFCASDVSYAFGNELFFRTIGKEQLMKLRNIGEKKAEVIITAIDKYAKENGESFYFGMTKKQLRRFQNHDKDTEQLFYSIIDRIPLYLLGIDKNEYLNENYKDYDVLNKCDTLGKLLYYYPILPNNYKALKDYYSLNDIIENLGIQNIKLFRDAEEYNKLKITDEMLKQAIRLSIKCSRKIIINELQEQKNQVMDIIEEINQKEEKIKKLEEQIAELQSKRKSKESLISTIVESDYSLQLKR